MFFFPCQIDLTQPLVPQGPFDVIVHKLSDVIVEAEHDSQSQQLLANFQVRLRCKRNIDCLYSCMSNYSTIHALSGLISPSVFYIQSYVSAHPSTVLLDPLPAMTQLLDRFASYRIMSKLHNSLRGQLQLHTLYCSSLLLVDINIGLFYYILFNRLAHLQSSLPRDPQCQ